MKLFDKLDDITIGKKGAALIFTPALVLLLFGYAFWRFHLSLVQDQNRALHSKQILILCEELLNELARAQSDIWAYALSEEPEMDARARGHISKMLIISSDLQRLVRAEPQQKLKLKALTPLLEHVGKQETTIQNAILAGKRDIVLDALSEVAVYERTKELRQDFERFIADEHLLSERWNKQLVESTDRLLVGFLIGIAFSAVSTLILGRLFSQNITTRVRSILSNLSRVPTGKPLAPANQGKDEIGQIDRALHEMAHSLIEKGKELELFLYSISHDIRSPLTNLQGFAEELRAHSDELKKITRTKGDRTSKLFSDVDQSITYILSASERLSSIMNSLLHLSRVGRLEFQFEAAPLDQVVRKVVNAMQASLKEKNIEVVVGELPTVWTDPAYFERALANLLTNSVQYSSPHRRGRIEIATSAFAARN